jgi:hypothetical protein
VARAAAGGDRVPPRFPRWLGLLVVLVGTVGGLIALSNATKFQGEQERGGATRVEFSVATRNYHHDLEDAASSLWYACVGSVSWEDATHPVQTSDDTFVASIRPALGEDSRRRFRGCLEDASVDRVLGDVLDMTQVAIG